MELFGSPVQMLEMSVKSEIMVVVSAESGKETSLEVAELVPK